MMLLRISPAPEYKNMHIVRGKISIPLSILQHLVDAIAKPGSATLHSQAVDQMEKFAMDVALVDCNLASSFLYV